MEKIHTRQYTDPCRELRKDIERMQNRIDEKDQEIGRQQSMIKQFESTKVGKLRDINARLCKTICVQDDIICGIVNEIEELRTDVRELNREIDGDHQKMRGLEVQIKEQESTEGIITGILRNANITLLRTIDERDADINRLKENRNGRRQSTKSDARIILKQNDRIEELEERLKAEEDEVARLRFIIGQEHDYVKELQQIIRNHVGYCEEADDTISCLHAGANANAIERKVDHDTIRTLNQHIISLEAERSVRKSDYDVLMKVVNVVKRWNDEKITSHPAMNQIAYVTKDHLNAPDGCD